MQRKNTMVSYFKQHFAIYLLLFAILGMWAFYQNGAPVAACIWAIFLAIIYRFAHTGKFASRAARGFVFGLVIDFLLLVALHTMHPEEDIAGIVIISLMLSGLLFAGIGYTAQHYLCKKH